ncbi:MAG: YdcF family protein [Patescibacteria group bacterium]
MKWLFWLIGFPVLLVAVVISGIISAGFFLSPQDALEKSDVIIAISGGETQQRVAEAVQLYRDGWAPLMIMSGAARDEGPSNALTMQNIAVAAGVPKNKILIEESATTTALNATFVRNIIEEKKFTKVILVTSPYHQRRASLAFIKALKGLPVKIINHSSTDSIWRKKGWWWDEWARELTWTEIQKTIYTWAMPLDKLT